MNVIKSKLDVDIEIDLTFTYDGELCTEVFMGHESKPSSFTTHTIYSLVKEYVDLASEGMGTITDSDCIEMAYNMINELQDAIDLLNESIGDDEDDG